MRRLSLFDRMLLNVEERARPLIGVIATQAGEIPDATQKALDRVETWAEELPGEVIEAGREWVEDRLEEVEKQAHEEVDEALEEYTEEVERLEGKADEAAEKLAERLGPLGPWAEKQLKKLIDSAREKAVEFGKDVAKDVKGWITGNIGHLKDKLKEAADALTKSIEDWLSEQARTPGTIANWVRRIWEGFKDEAIGLAIAVCEWVRDAVGVGSGDAPPDPLARYHRPVLAPPPRPPSGAGVLYRGTEDGRAGGSPQRTGRRPAPPPAEPARPGGSAPSPSSSERRSPSAAEGPRRAVRTYTLHDGKQLTGSLLLGRAEASSDWSVGLFGQGGDPTRFSLRPAVKGRAEAEVAAATLELDYRTAPEGSRGGIARPLDARATGRINALAANAEASLDATFDRVQAEAGFGLNLIDAEVEGEVSIPLGAAYQNTVGRVLGHLSPRLEKLPERFDEIKLAGSASGAFGMGASATVDTEGSPREWLSLDGYFGTLGKPFEFDVDVTFE
jgi:uncharacterized protein YjbJ (UPF0337 family)